MPDFWQFPTVSMGLGPMMAIYQARFMRYLENRGILPPQDRKVWCFLGDGETDEPESMGAITMPVRERLDNLVFVINCNLQRLDGPVRGNGKIIQELEAAYQGAGWNVIKVVWGSRWDPLLARDQTGVLRKTMEECVDGEYQAFKAKGGALHTRAFLRPTSRAQSDGRASVGRRHLALEPRRPRPREGVCRVPSSRASPGAAHGDSREDCEGLRYG
jgi:pyruvate dehydrogenase complex dehydrogenase (E1) component